MNRRHRDELGRADDVDSPVGPVLEPEDFIASDQPVLDDPVEIASDKLIRPARAHPGRHPKLPARRARGDARRERFGVSAPEGDLGQMEIRHAVEVAIQASFRNRLVDDSARRGEAENGQVTH